MRENKHLLAIGLIILVFEMCLLFLLISGNSAQFLETKSSSIIGLIYILVLIVFGLIILNKSEINSNLKKAILSGPVFRQFMFGFYLIAEKYIKGGEIEVFCITGLFVVSVIISKIFLIVEIRAEK
jgi:hypothetical protein